MTAYLRCTWHRANSREITTAILEKHLAPVKLVGLDEPAPNHGSRVGWREGNQHWSISFVVGSGGNAHQLFLVACEYALPHLLATLNEKRVFDFPIRQGDLANLFGDPEYVTRSPVISLVPNRC